MGPKAFGPCYINILDAFLANPVTLALKADVGNFLDHVWRADKAVRPKTDQHFALATC